MRNLTMSKYNFSITKGSLFPKDSWYICLDYLSSETWQEAKVKSRNNIIFQHVKDQTFSTKYGLIKSRLEILPKQLWSEMTNYEDFVHLLYLSACLKHRFFGDFVLEVVRDQYLLMQYKLTEDHFRSYIFTKMDAHPEVEKLREYTQGKIRQTCMRILSEVEIIQSTRKWIIMKPIISSLLIQVLQEENKYYLKYFLLSDFEIDNR